MLNKPCTSQSFSALTNYVKMTHYQAYSYLDPNADLATQRKGVGFLDDAEKAMELAVAFLKQGDVPIEFSSITIDFLHDIARSRALRVEYLSAKGSILVRAFVHVNQFMLGLR